MRVYSSFGRIGVALAIGLSATVVDVGTEQSKGGSSTLSVGVLRDANASRLSRGIRRARRQAERAGRRIRRAGEEAARDTAHAARAAGEAIKEGAEKLGQNVTHAAAKVAKKLKEFSEAVGSAVTRVADFVKEGFDKLLSLLGDVWDKVVDWIKEKATAYIRNAVQDAKAAIQRIFGGAKEKVISRARELLRKGLRSVAEHAVKPSWKTMQTLRKLVKNNGSIDETAVRKTLTAQALDVLGDHAMPMVRATVADAFALFKAPLDAAVNGVASSLGSIPLAGGPVFSAVVFTYDLAVNELLGFIAKGLAGAALKPLLNEIAGEAVTRALKPVSDAVTRMVQGAAKTIQARAALPVAIDKPTIAKPGADIDRAIDEFEQRNPPVIRKVARPSDKPWWKLAEKIWDKVIDWMEDQLKKAMKFVKDKALSKIREYFDQIKDKAIAAAQKLVQKAIEGMLGRMVEDIPYERLEAIAAQFAKKNVDAERASAMVSDLIESLARPFVRARMIEVLDKVLASLKGIFDGYMKAFGSAVSEVPLVGGAVGGVILIAYSMLKEKTMAFIVDKLLDLAQKLVKPMIRALVKPFTPTLVDRIRQINALAR
ncbi:MAG: hypothetical protein HYY84_14990 [Deltaproteobacteria bacterium]|nr:hypothetical protein [Deltaproteobacteria bacterium]